MQAHNLEPLLEAIEQPTLDGQPVSRKIGWRCTVCGDTWIGKPRADNCPGMMWYRVIWGWPDNLVTVHQMERRGLKLAPDQQAVAVGNHNQIPLYEAKDCLPLWAEGEPHVIQRADHLVELVGDERGMTERCIKCERLFAGHAWGKCPGVKQYQWEPWPEGLYTARQINAKGLKPGPVRGAIYYEKSRDGWLWLHRLEEAIPKPEKSERQKAAAAALREANRLAWICVECEGRNEHRIRGGGRCRMCSERQWARDMLALPDLRILDVETTGLYGDAEIIQIGVIDVEGNSLLDTFVKPVRPIIEKVYEAYEDDGLWHEDEPLTAFGVNGISNAMVSSAPSFPEMWELLRPIITDKPIIAYSADFDRRILRQCRIAHGLQPIRWTHFGEAQSTVLNWHCAMLSFSCFYGDWSRKYRDYRYKSLSTACSYFKISIEERAHGAMGDCLRTLELLKALAKPAEKPKSSVEKDSQQ